jgi:NADPH:quinone reductase-like Zn-dependent oxidoreductase
MELHPMKAAVYTRYGGPQVVQIGDVPSPQPRKGEVLIRMLATTVSSGDARLRAMRMPRGMGLLGRLAFGLTGPRKRVLGSELAGVVTDIGPGVTRFAPGDAVIGFTGMRMGAHAEFCVMREDAAIIHRPAHLSDAQAAALAFGGTTALHYLLDKGALRSGERVLILGGSGAVGSAAVQIARALGAHVTATCSRGNFDLVRGLGADEVIDYRSTDVTLSATPFDIVMDSVGATTFSACLPILSPGGRFLLVAGDLPQMLGALRKGPQGKRAIGGVAPERAADLETLAQFAAGGLFVPVIDSSFPLERIADAHARVDSGHKRGSVVVTFGAPASSRIDTAVPGAAARSFK